MNEKQMRNELPYVMVAHRGGKGFYFLNRNYQLITGLVPKVYNYRDGLTARNMKLLKFFFKNKTQDWRGWVPSTKSQVPFWAEGIEYDEFTAFWVKDHHDADAAKVEELVGIMDMPELPRLPSPHAYDREQGERDLQKLIYSEIENLKGQGK